ncbi:DDE-type integrase/transposase/recombinase [Cupriavidus sp. D384]|uniref:DDE-type integrase/transposase/recombinase n=1 Tax=Cupriavidus sp. D384 TaxID=1538095 RepID=UPI000B08BFFA|nr:DDE-type integrase/transposase/recombinase [Cupriavidus sp. D384]
MDDSALNILLSKWNMPLDGRYLVEGVRRKRQDKLSRDTIGCVGYMPSRKMGGVVAAPGRNVGLPLAILFEHDPQVLEYYFQPFSLEIPVYREDGRLATYVNDAPSVMLIREDGVFVQSWRTEGDLEELRGKSPNFYKDQDYSWHWRPAEKYYALLRIHHQTRSQVEIQRQHILTMNLDDLSRYSKKEPLDASVCRALRDVLDREVVLTLRQLQEGFDFDADDVRTAIFQGQLDCDLVHERLDGTDSFHLYRNAEDMRIFGPDVRNQDLLPFAQPENVWVNSLIPFDGATYRVEGVYGDRVKLRGKGDARLELPLTVVAAASARSIVDLDGGVRESLRHEYRLLTEAEEMDASHKLNAVRTGTSIRSDRQMRRYRASVRNASTTAEAVAALATRERDRGNREPRRPALEALARRFILHVIHLGPRISIKGAFDSYVRYCEKKGLPTFSMATFRIRVHRYRNLVRQHGSRAALAMTPIATVLNSGRLPNGWLPHQFVHIDHTPADVEVVGPTGMNLKRPLITIAHDACIHCARAIYLSFGSANAECVLMVLRDYVRRWGRLPKYVIVDGGINLRSQATMRFFKDHEMTVIRRAKRNPRQGAPIEATNKARELQVDVLLPGSTSHLKDDVRAYNGHPSPKSKARETVVSLYRRYEQYYLVRKYSNDKHPALGLTPEEYETELFLRHGRQPFLAVSYDEQFLIDTAPYPVRPIHSVDSRRGVWVGYRWYQHEAFATAKRDAKAAVRIERFNADVVYVEYKRRMLVATASDINPFPGRTSYQMEQAIRQFHEEAGRLAQRSALKPSELHDVLGLEARHFDPVIGMREEELRRLYSGNGMIPRVDAVNGTIEVIDPKVAEAIMRAQVDAARHYPFASTETNEESEDEAKDSNNELDIEDQDVDEPSPTVLDPAPVGLRGVNFDNVPSLF